MRRYEQPSSRCVVVRFFRPFGAEFFVLLFTHGLRRGLHSCAASRLSYMHMMFLVGVREFTVRWVRRGGPLRPDFGLSGVVALRT
jgi:hypothetical protein